MSIGQIDTGLPTRLPLGPIAEACRRHGVSGLWVHGPILERTPEPAEEVEFLVEFLHDDFGPWGSKLDLLENDLSGPMHRKVRVSARGGIGGAIHVLDRSHIMKQFGKALDGIRAEETKRLKRDGYEPVLSKSRWCLLKRPENLTVKLSELRKYNLRTVRAYLLREDFQRFWEYRGPAWAGKFLDE